MYLHRIPGQEKIKIQLSSGPVQFSVALNKTVLSQQAHHLLQCRHCLYSVIDHCLILNREGLGTSLLIMGLATKDTHSQKEHTEIHKNPKFGVNQASFDADTAI